MLLFSETRQTADGFNSFDYECICIITSQEEVIKNPAIHRAQKGNNLHDFTALNNRWLSFIIFVS